jgi:Uma2 family endonuclease
MATEARLYTVVDLEALPDDGNRYELDRGMLITMPPPKREHGLIVNQIAYLVTGHVEANDLGEVAAEIGYQLEQNPDTVRAPEVSFTATARLKIISGEYEQTPPDLAVEVASPGNTVSDMNEKIEQYFAAGVRLVWLFFPKTRKIHVYNAANKITVLGEEDFLDGGDVLPGFRVSVHEIFKPLDRLSQ